MYEKHKHGRLGAYNITHTESDVAGHYGIGYQ